MDFLHEIFENSIARRQINQIQIPLSISDNLKFTIRPYQAEAFRRYIFLEKEDLPEKPGKPYHLLFNMATGSGKTMVMAGLILHLFEHGYRNFLFLVNSNNIIKKTRDNFLNTEASKYLFKKTINIDGSQILMKELQNFDEADSENINIKFTTVQQLHSDLNNTKENSITYADLKDRKLVIIADEAHHLSSATKKNGALFGSWESTVVNILQQNLENILLEFTATLDYESRFIVDKYKRKVIFKYDLAQFRKDKYSKEINLLRSHYDEKQRIIQALVLNLYREHLANSNGINLKPVILFKAKRTVKESEENKQRFNALIETLSEEMIEEIERTSTVPIVKKAFQFFRAENIPTSQIVQRIKRNFRPENCLSANDDKDAERNQILLNTLEDENNPIRAIFAVQKLNEGWDVLNLFDIVRLYEERDGRQGKPGATTLSEAQLIGRGARYFPFRLNESQDKYLRKYDDDIENDLKVLEELYYHTKEDSKYISELKKALIESGIYEDEENLVTRELKLKLHFTNTEFYRNGYVFFNRRIEKKYDRIKSFQDLGVKSRHYMHELSSGVGTISSAFAVMDEAALEDRGQKEKDISFADIPRHVVRYAISQNPFFYFRNLNRYFPHIRSIDNFITSEDYLAGLSITFRGTKERIEELSNLDHLHALHGLLQEIETDIKNHSTEYEGSHYMKEPIHKIFKNKTIRINRNSERADGQELLVAEEPWYAYNANYGTSEEKNFIKLFARRFEGLSQKFDDIYLMRNEREIKIYDNAGNAFEPDFLLFCKQKGAGHLTYQVFIEPKGAHLLAHDKWKENFLKQISTERKTFEIHTDTYLITAVPFYNYSNENEFNVILENELAG